MYIEVFLADNFAMDMIIVKAASAMCGLTYSVKTAIIVCILLSVYSAFAMKYHWLCGFVFKLILCFVAAVPFFVKQKRLSFLPILCVLISTVLAGGFVTAFSVAAGSKVISGSYMRLIIYPLFVLVCTPSVARRIKRSFCIRSFETCVRVCHDGKEYCFDAIIDSGNTLAEPVSGIPIILVYAPYLAEYAHLPFLYGDTGGTSNVIYAFSPETVYIGENAVEAMIAPTDKNPGMKALVPYSAAMLCNFDEKER